MLGEQKPNGTVLENLEASRRVAESFANKRSEPSERRGLCCNCDLRESCHYRGVDVGIWYCETYQ
jgi:hypothetical protein